MESKSLQVGQEVSIKCRTSYKFNSEVEVIDAVITSVGKKYFTMDKTRDSKFYIESLQEVTQYTVSRKVYLDKQVLLDEIEKDRLISFIRKQLDGYKLKDVQLDKLREIHSILSS